MLLLPAAALCCLCSALVTMAAELVQRDLTVVSRAGHAPWYRPHPRFFFRLWTPSETEVFVRVCSTVGGSSDKYLVFGTGTKLYVSDDKVEKPVVSVFSPGAEAHPKRENAKTSLLCAASNMFPPEVRFIWKKQKKNDPRKKLSPAEGEQLELSETGRTASIMVVDPDPLELYEYSCSVQHEAGQVEAGARIEVSPCQTSGPRSNVLRERLPLLLYSLLTLKSLVYCCGLSVFRICRNRRGSTD